MKEPLSGEDALYNEIELADMMLELTQDSRFIRLFEEQYIEAFAVTNTMTIAAQDKEGRARTHEKMVARSHFVQFIAQTMEAGSFAKEALIELRDEADQES